MNFSIDKEKFAGNLISIIKNSWWHAHSLFMVKFCTLSPCLMDLSYSLYMQFLKLFSEHFGVIKPGEYDIDVRLAVLESANMVVFLCQRIHTALSDMVVVCGG